MTRRTSFKQTISDTFSDLNRTSLSTVQINVGKLCNQACLHCHVEAGPKRTEIMPESVALRIIELMRASPHVKTIDITGGAPELNEHFRSIAQSARELGKEVIDRCNLTVFFEPNQQDLPEFLKQEKIRVVASLPCYSRDNVEKQRGTGVFQKSIDALVLLNSLGYGKPNSSLILDLVYNPLGATLPPAQKELETAYKHELRELFNIEFNSLFTITNVPISRFLHQLKREKRYEEYMDLLATSFNPHAAENVMCRSLISVSWTGEFFDCDFNQMLELPLGGQRRTIWDLESFDELGSGPIAFADHCYACTAGCGSSCTGATEYKTSESLLNIIQN